MIETIKTDQNMNIDIEVKLDKHLISFKKVLLNQWLTRVLSLSGSKHALKEHKKEAVATVKKLIMQYKLSMDDLRGKAQKQLES